MRSLGTRFGPGPVSAAVFRVVVVVVVPGWVAGGAGRGGSRDPPVTGGG